LTGGVFMSRKDIVKVSFNEDLQEESYYFMKRLVEKVLIDQLDLKPKMKGFLLEESNKIVEKE
jgi:hypothetical protein